MQTLELTSHRLGEVRASATVMRSGSSLLSLAGVILVLLGGCSKKGPGMDAVETDANGYYCRNCQARMFTERRVFLEDCPKCCENALVDVVGYWCETDQYLTIRPQVASPEGASVCEKCGVPLKAARVSPREKDLLAWGATKAESP